MLADSKLPTMFWTKAVRTACYVLNRVLVTSPHNKTLYALLTGNIPLINHFKPFGCHVIILNTSDHLGKFDGIQTQNVMNKSSLSLLIHQTAYKKLSLKIFLVMKLMILLLTLLKKFFKRSFKTESPYDLGNNEPSLGIFSSLSYDDEFGVDLNNLASTVEVSPIATKRINTIHPQSLIIGDCTSVVQTRSKEEMQEFKFQNVWVLVDLPEDKYAIVTKWILKNKRDARGIVLRNKARLVAQGHR
ncbi:putative ribonuclease H-like domain-containing protein [Tanacetum coccineum]